MFLSSGTEIALSKWSNEVGIFIPLPDDGNRCSSKNVTFQKPTVMDMSEIIVMFMITQNRQK
jgi:hypothetical protein